jgi:hypothetical protein
MLTTLAGPVLRTEDSVAPGSALADDAEMPTTLPEITDPTTTSVIRPTLAPFMDLPLHEGRLIRRPTQTCGSADGLSSQIRRYCPPEPVEPLPLVDPPPELVEPLPELVDPPLPPDPPGFANPGEPIAGVTTV